MDTTTIVVLALALAGVSTTYFTGIELIHALDQRQRDKYRTLYQIHTPSELPYKSWEAFITSLKAIPSVKPAKATDTVVLERYAKGKDIRYYLSVPDHLKESVKALFGGHVKGGMLVEPEEDLVRETKWDKFTELALSNHHKPLLIPSPEQAITNVLSGFANLEDDAVLTQIPLVPTKPPSSDEDRAKGKDKYAYPLFFATMRLATAGAKSDSLMHRLYTGLRSLNQETEGVHFVKRMVSTEALRSRVWRRATSVHFRCVLNSVEAAVLTSPVVSGVTVAGLPKVKAMPPSDKIPREGIVIGNSDYPGLTRPLALSQKALTMNVHIIGPIGSGKSTLLENMAAQAISQNMGLVVIEPKGDLARHIADFIPPERIKDVIWFDPNDKEFPIGMNILDGPDPERTASNVVAIFKKKYPDAWGPRLEYILSHAIYTAAIAKLDFYGVKQLLVNADFRAKILRKINDNDLKQFWRGFDAQSDQYAASVINKLDAFLRPVTLRNILSQRDGLKMADVVRRRNIVLIPLEALIGEENAAVFGALFVACLWQHILQRLEHERYPVVVILDEFYEYLSFGIDNILARSRSYQMPLVLAHQNLSQLEKTLPAVENNARTKIAYTPAHKDAEALSHYFDPMTASDLKNIPEFSIALKAMTDTGLAPVATGATMPPPKPLGNLQAVIEHSRKTWGRPAAEVEKERDERYQLGGQEKRKPKIGEVDDDDDE